MAAAVQQTVSLPQNHVSEFFAQLDALKGQQIYGDERLHWMVQLRQTIFGDSEQNIEAVSLSDKQAVESMLALSERLCDWSIVAYLRQERQDGLQPSINNQLRLTHAFYQLGKLHEAVDNQRTLLLQHYQRQDIADDYWHLQKNLSSIPYDLAQISSGYLRLVPLQSHHFESFCWAYDDPEIARLVNLPDFQNKQQWLAWLEDNHRDSNRVVFALNHAEWGFIGSVCLEVHEGVGFFYYWLGVDFQGQGFGTEVLNLLLDVGKYYHDITCCYAKVFEHNIASQKVMEKVGFEQLPFSANEPFDDECYYYIGVQQEEQGLHQQLQWLFDRQGGYTRLKPGNFSLF